MCKIMHYETNVNEPIVDLLITGFIRMVENPFYFTYSGKCEKKNSNKIIDFRQSINLLKYVAICIKNIP